MVVRRAIEKPLLERAFALRERVFCDEQEVAPGAEFDGRDGDALHLVAVEGESVVGTCRLLFEQDAARVGRMAVERSQRRAGIGSALLAEAEGLARAEGARRIVLHAQVAAERFYARAGYEARGERFIEEGIEHVAMERALA